MRYSNLIKYPLPPMPTFTNKNKEYKIYYHAEVLDDVLAITLWQYNWKTDKIDYTIRHFFNGSEYVTQNICKNKQANGVLAHYCHCDLNPINKNNAQSVILKYLESKNIPIAKRKYTRFDGVFAAIESREDELLKSKLDKKHKVITDRIDERMNLIGELPKEFTKWIDDCATGKRNIFGLRNAKTPNEPYFTVRLGNDGKLIQNLGKSNCSPPKEVNKFVEQWLKKAVKPNLSEFKKLTATKPKLNQADLKAAV